MDMKKLNKALSVCAGPECCKEACPYYNETKGGKTCRAWLLTDAQVAIAAKEAENAALAEEVNRITSERDDMDAECKTYRDERDALRKKCEELEKKVAYLTADRDALRAAKDELDAELHRTQQREAAMLNGETDRKSVGRDQEYANGYKRGYKEAMEYCFKALCARVGGGCRHE